MGQRQFWLCLLAGGVILTGHAGLAQGIEGSLLDPQVLLPQNGGSLAQRSIQLLILVTLLSIVPGIAVTVTCFPFIVTVFSILRQAIGLQQAPPNMLIISLALFLSWYIMEPSLTLAWDTGAAPYIAGDIPLEDAALRSIAPFRDFMAARVDGDTFTTLADLRPATTGSAIPQEAPLSLLVPAFLLSEIERAFQIGFLIYLPFLIIDLVVAAILMSMGMMMVPPASVALPFKLGFFVIADGWSLIAASLVQGYATG